MMIPPFKIIRKKISYNCIVELYNFLYLFRTKLKIHPHVLSIEETIDKIVAGKISISRFGDGEILLAGTRKSIGFQKFDKELSYRLQEVLSSDESNHLVCVSDVFDGLDRYTRRARRFWRTQFYLYGFLWEKHLENNKVYGNTFVTRPYMDFKDKSKSGEWFSSLKKIWDGRDVLFVEGDESRLGVGNKLFDNVKSVSRILCPALNAFDKYDAIYNEVIKLDKKYLVLIALGPTATVLAYDLHKSGYQAVDIGHVDIEYEWYNMRASHKVSVPSKYVNEALTGQAISAVKDSDYNRQVIARI